MIKIINIDGNDITYDYDAYTATVNGVIRPATDEERFMMDNTKQALITDAIANEEARRRSDILSNPITPLDIEGTTVEEVTASAQFVIADLASQMEAKINILITGQ
jgi:hypothetical protein